MCLRHDFMHTVIRRPVGVLATQTNDGDRWGGSAITVRTEHKCTCRSG